MLVLSRKENESLVVADTVTVTIVRIDRDKVRLAIEAPREIPVHRKEVQLRIEQERATGRVHSMAK